MRSIWAVAINTIRQALRMKIAVVFIILLLILLPVMGILTTGDGTLVGRLKTFTSYGLSLCSLLLCLLTVIASTYTITSDIKDRQIFTVLTKPIRRYQLLLGKLLGVIFLDVVLLVLFASIIYSIIIYMPKFSEADSDQLAKASNEFYTARIGLVPAEIDVTEDVKKAYEKLERTQQLPTGMSHKQIIYRLTLQKKLEKSAAPVGHDLTWEFENVRPTDPNQDLSIRYKYEVAQALPGGQILGKWLIGDFRQIRVKTPIYPFQRKDAIKTYLELTFPSDAIAEDGFLGVAFLNDPQSNNTTVIFPPDSPELLYTANTFTSNFLRNILLILLRLIFLTCLGVCASTFLSFPVAILLCLVAFLTGTISGFIIDSFDYLSQNMGGIYSYTIKPIVRLLPRFDKYDPSEFLVPARLLTWPVLVKVTATMVCIKSVLLFVIALFIFTYREIAKIVV